MALPVELRESCGASATRTTSNVTGRESRESAIFVLLFPFSAHFRSIVSCSRSEEIATALSRLLLEILCKGSPSFFFLFFFLFFFFLLFSSVHFPPFDFFIFLTLYFIIRCLLSSSIWFARVRTVLSRGDFPPPGIRFFFVCLSEH